MAAGDSGVLCPCTFQLPLQYNDGRDVEPELLTWITEELNRRFNGCTDLGPCDGIWLGQREPSVRMEVSVPEQRIEDLKTFVIQVGQLLKQSVMYFNQGPPTVRLLTVDDVSDLSPALDLRRTDEFAWASEAPPAVGRAANHV